MNDITKKYSNGEITVVWKPALCIHSTICWKGAAALPEVFDPHIRPWIRPENSDTQRIMQQVKQCPSGALSFIVNDAPTNEEKIIEERIVEALSNGPLLVHGNFILKDENGLEKKTSKVTALCRCGASNNKPYCDGTHSKINFTTEKIL